jgi:hypothetical protein
MEERSSSSGLRPMCRPSSRARPHAGTHPLDDQVALKFGDGPDDDNHGAA